MTQHKTPICVDLDHTFIKTDILHEQFILLIKKSPIYLFLLPLWLTKGRSYLKTQIAARVEIDVDTLPYNDDVITFLTKKSNEGHPIYLVTASHEKIAQKIIRKFEFFSGGKGSEGDLNLKGAVKAKYLNDEFGEKKYDYIGDSKADIHVWRHANNSYFVGNNPPAIEGNFTETFPRKRNSIKSIFKSLRTYQWAKNILILAPVFLAHRYNEVAVWKDAWLGFFSFSMTASSVYIFNDLLDLSNDRVHHKKKFRPLASGDVSIPVGILTLIALLSLSIWSSFCLGPMFLLCTFIYFIINIFYSFLLKKVPIIDVICLSSFYMIRLEAGGFATQIHLTHWLIIFSLFIFISLGFLKRYCELLEEFKNSGKTNVDGRGYNTNDLTPILIFGAISAQISVLSFTQYLFLGGALKYYAHPKLLFINAILFFYWLTSLWFKGTRGKVSGDPVGYAIRDKESLIFGALSILNLFFVKHFDFLRSLF